MPMETRHDLEHTTERLTEGLRCPWKWGQCLGLVALWRAILESPGRPARTALLHQMAPKAVTAQCQLYETICLPPKVGEN